MVIDARGKEVCGKLFEMRDVARAAGRTAIFERKTGVWRVYDPVTNKLGAILPTNPNPADK